MSHNNNWQTSSAITPENVADFSIDDDLIETDDIPRSNDPFGDAGEDDDIMIEPDVAPSSTTKKSAPTSNVSGSIPAAPSSGQAQSGNGLFSFGNYSNPFSANAFTTNLNNEINSNIKTRERQFTGGNTLDESVLQTMKRDVDKIGQKLLHIFWPIGLRKKLQTVQKFTRLNNNSNDDDDDHEEEVGISNEDSEQISKDSILKILDWDLWGPLLITLLFSLAMTFLQIRSLDPKYETKASQIFSGAFTMIWGSLFVLSLNTQLLSPFHDKTATHHGNTISLSIFQCISIFGYALFPITVGALISIVVKFKFIRIPIFAILWTWSNYSIYLIIRIVNNSGANKGKGDDRLFLIVFPVALVFGVFSWLCIIS